ncbi:MAG TPA: redox-regulated ATPase YchF [Candidatus Omnitrophica bacterium]|nr:redox-regulated ATPase YchF [Candidatus Omnitrophota bacterium]
MKIGIVGLPNVGKSTVFNALTAGYAPSSNYPFCTIEPNRGVVEIPDERLEELASFVMAKEKRPVTVEFVDIAGLIKGASKGEGLGNRFLSHIREVNVILHVVRCFKDPQISHPFPEIEPVRDIEIVNLELIMADLQMVEDRLKKLKEPNDSRDVLSKVKGYLERGESIASIVFEQKEILDTMGFLTSKPTIYVANIKEDDEESLTFAEEVRRKADGEGSKVIVLPAKLEEEISHLADEEKEEYRRELGIEEKLKKLINICYDALGFITFYTIAHQKVSAWSVREGTSAKEAAGKVHSEMKEGFIKAEVIPFVELMRYTSYQEAKDDGKLRIEGKDYIVKDGDVLYFKFHIIS